MRIAHIPIPLSVAGSSVTTVVRHLSREGSARGHEQYVILAAERDVTVAHATNLRVPYSRYCPREWFTSREMQVDHAAGLAGLPRPYSARMFIPAIEAVRRLTPDWAIVHEGHYATGSLAYFHRLWPRGRVMLYVHTPISRAYRRPELQRLLRRAHSIAFVSAFARDALQQRVGSLEVPTAVVHNGVDTEVFHAFGRQAGNRLRITFAGQVAPHKGVHLLLRAARAARCDIQLRIVGSATHGASASLTEYEKKLRAEPGRAGLDVQFLPFQTPTGLAQVFRESDVVCVPSVWDEPFGMVALEAMSCGAAVIASSRGGLPEACGGAANLIGPEDLEEFASAIDQLADPTLLKERQTMSLVRCTEVTWGHVYGRLSAFATT